MKITTVLPAYNEEKTIQEIIQQAKKYSDNVIVVISKNNKDKTPEIARGLGVEVIFDQGKGKGQALREAITHIKEGIIVFMDCDGSHDAKDIPKLAEPLKKNEADMVIASRRLGGSDELHGTFSYTIRSICTSLIVLAINVRWGKHLSDVENGFRAIKSDIAKNLHLTANDFDIEQEMVMKALKKKYRIKEVASHEYERRYGASKLNLVKIGWKFIWSYIKHALWV